jgi:hypothetical protein
VPELNQWLLDNLWLVTAVLLAGIIGLAIAVIVLGRRLETATRAYRDLVDEASGGSLGATLAGQTARVEAVDTRLGELTATYGALEARSRGSLQHVGLVRFNPFDDTGSDQSFAIALLDADHNGIVVSSLHGRAGTRVFAKPITSGQATHALSDEESEALRIATSGPPASDR